MSYLLNLNHGMAEKHGDTEVFVTPRSPCFRVPKE